MPHLLDVRRLSEILKQMGISHLPLLLLEGWWGQEPEILLW